MKKIIILLSLFVHFSNALASESKITSEDFSTRALVTGKAIVPLEMFECYKFKNHDAVKDSTTDWNFNKNNTFSRGEIVLVTRSDNKIEPAIIVKKYPESEIYKVQLLGSGDSQSKKLKSDQIGKAHPPIMIILPHAKAKETHAKETPPPYEEQTTSSSSSSSSSKK